MPYMPPLKPSAKQPRVKVTKSPPPGGGRGRPIKVTGRDPRAGKPASVRNPNRSYR
jgi:hypothetical protein